MKHIGLFRKTVLTLGTAAATGALLAAATPAQAAEGRAITPFSATGCTNNVCIYLAGNAGGTVLVQAWARNTTFRGTFRVTGPNENWTSADQTWFGNKGNYASTSWYTNNTGQVCAAGYSDSNVYQGTACENLGR
jgi:hypothetical protein